MSQVLVPAAIGGRVFSDGDIITVPEGGGQVHIRLADLKDKHLGQLDLPMMRIDFDFNGLSDEEVKAFMVTTISGRSRGLGNVKDSATNRFLPPHAAAGAGSTAGQNTF